MLLQEYIKTAIADLYKWPQRGGGGGGNSIFHYHAAGWSKCTEYI